MAKKRIDMVDEHDVLGRLTERVEKAIATIQSLRRERDELRQKLAKAESAAKLGDTSALEEELERYRTERDEVRTRLERLLENLERLEDS